MKINIEKAKELLSRGKVVAIPTETVYGLAALSTNPQAVQNIFFLKVVPPIIRSYCILAATKSVFAMHHRNQGG